MPMIRGTVLCSTLFAVAIASSAAAQSDTSFRWSKKVADGAYFAIRNLNGSIEVRPGSTDTIRVWATIRVDARSLASGLDFEVHDRAADDVEICTVERSVNACDSEDSRRDDHPFVRYVVDLPRGIRLRATTGGGDVIVMQTVREIDASTNNGDVVIRESTGRVSAASGSGDVTIAAGSGSVSARSGNGRVVVNTDYGPVNATSGNGSIDVRLISTGAPADQSMAINSGNGNVKLTLPGDFNGQIQASSGHGGVKSDFSLHEERGAARGKFGNGNGLSITVHSGNGRVEIRKD
jgi:hypothetical protein